MGAPDPDLPLIDVHAHFLTEAYVAAAARRWPRSPGRDGELAKLVG
jgi:hypothetical protein